MAGKRDEIFLLGEEEARGRSPSAPEEEPSARAPVPGSSRSSHLRGLLLGGGLVLIAAIVFIGRPSGDAVDPAPPRASAPAPEVAPVARAPRQLNRPHRAPERQPQRPLAGESRKAVKEREEPPPAPLAEAPSAPAVTYAPAPEAAREPAPEGRAAAPAQAAPLPAAWPEFGIER